MNDQPENDVEYDFSQSESGAMGSSLRIKRLDQLLRLSFPLIVILNDLRDFEWDCEEPLIVLDVAFVKLILQRFVAGQLTASDVEDWANAIEGRDDIDYSGVGNVLHMLANPSLTEPLTLEVAHNFLDLCE